MANEDIRYQFVEVTAVRGTERRAAAKKEAEGWELVEQDQGRVKTTLKFRRPKPPLPRKQIAIAAGVAVVLGGILAVGVALEGDDDAVEAESAAAVVEEPAEPLDVPPATNAETPSDSPVAVEPLTAGTNPDLAGLLQLTDTCSPSIADFAATYAGQTIQFDGHIGALANYETYDTRYLVLLSAGDFDESNPVGPNFQYRDINLVSDLNWTGTNIPDGIEVNDRFRFTSTVKSYEEQTCLLLLEPVATEAR
ncbi:DUF4839 domain-containing protein [Dietzia sp. MNB45]|uniref:DUF4839 domain-containing protein n=1 Tax=Dietzia sp. MNB45 TaxID=3238800 RepID=UPI003F7EEB82